MKDKFSLDSNVLLYTPDNDKGKKLKAKSLLRNLPFTSPQLIFECVNVSLKKFKMTKAVALNFSRLLIKYSNITEENLVIENKLTTVNPLV